LACGVVSYGPVFPDIGNDPGVYARVSTFSAWLDDIINSYPVSNDDVCASCPTNSACDATNLRSPCTCYAGFVLSPDYIECIPVDDIPDCKIVENFLTYHGYETPTYLLHDKKWGVRRCCGLSHWETTPQDMYGEDYRSSIECGKPSRLQPYPGLCKAKNPIFRSEIDTTLLIY
jgi:hypothetical protein